VLVEARSASPMLKGSVVKQALEAVKRLPPEQASHIRRLTPPAVIEQIEKSLRVDWVDYSLHLELEQAVLAALGPRQFVEFRRRHNNQLSESPALRSVFSLVVGWLGVSPRRFFHLVPRAMQLLVRDAGTMEVVDEGPTRLRVVYKDVPSPIVANPCWRLGLVGSFQMVLDLTRRNGNIEVTEYDTTRGTVSVSVDWDD